MNINANTSIALKLGLASVVMFGFGYALVPLYDVLCEITGLNGKTGRISATEAGELSVDIDRLITVEFDTNTNSELPWEFRPLTPTLQVHPGEVNEAIFYVKNTSDEYIIGQAIPSVAPSSGSRFFNKTECFCFTRQPLAPGESKEMPVRFVVEPGLPGHIRMLTLSYAFFPHPESGTAIGMKNIPIESKPKS